MTPPPSSDSLVQPDLPVLGTSERVADLEIQIRDRDKAREAALAAGQVDKAARIAAHIEKLSKALAVAQRKADQEALERADAGLPVQYEAFDDEDSALDAQPRRPVPEAALTAAAEAPRPPAALSRPRARHWAVLLSFVILVCGPTALASWYLWERATDRFISRAGFSVRTEEVGSAIDTLIGAVDLSGSSSNDPAVLYAFIQSQDMVATIDARLDLRAMWAKADPAVDPIFAYHPPGTIEDMTDYWQRMVKVYNDDAGLIDMVVYAFTAEDAKALAEAIYDEASLMINNLSAIARDDTTGYARDELAKTLEDLRMARVALTQFRNRTQIVDPSASLQSQMGILNSLQQQLAESLIELDLLRLQGVGESDPRVVQGVRRVEVIRARINDEQRKLGIGGTGISGSDSNAFANIVGEYESLIVDLEFAEQSYTAARATFEASVAEARRQSRYLAAHVSPTLPQRAEAPERVTLLILTALFSFLTWAILVLAAYALRDRR